VILAERGKQEQEAGCRSRLIALVTSDGNQLALLLLLLLLLPLPLALSHFAATTSLSAITCFGCAPIKRSINFPSLKINIVGMLAI
jgi:hypothetical protein